MSKRGGHIFAALLKSIIPVNVLRVEFVCCYYSNRACNHDFFTGMVFNDSFNNISIISWRSVLSGGENWSTL